MNYILPALFSFGVTLGLIKGALLFFPKWGLMDKPEKYGLSREAIPYFGGLTMIFGFLLSLLLFVGVDAKILSMIVGIVMLGVVSFLDDKYGLSPFLRLGVQILAALILVFGGVGVHYLSNPFGNQIFLDIGKFTFWGKELFVVSTLFMVFWVVLLINTMNFLDGLNGLTSGVSTIASVALFLLSVRPGLHGLNQEQFSIIAIIFVGVVFAFWLFDFYPSKLLMGDTGSVFLGFMLAVLSIFSGGKVATAFLVLGFPILDVFWVVLRRIREGNSPFKGDLMHFHHRLLYKGLSVRKALVVIYFLCALFGFIAVFLPTSLKLWAVVTLFLVMLGVMMVL